MGPCRDELGLGSWMQMMKRRGTSKMYTQIKLSWNEFQPPTSLYCVPKLHISHLHFQKNTENTASQTVCLDVIFHKKHLHFETAWNLQINKRVTAATTGSYSPPSQTPFSSTPLFIEQVHAGSRSFHLLLKLRFCKISFLGRRICRGQVSDHSIGIMHHGTCLLGIW